VYKVIYFKYVMSVVQTTVNWILVRSLQHWLLKHLLCEPDAHYGDFI